ncbi:PTS sugar transporter subunit IIA [Vagococcus sp. BWB3-3]|uniref:PTS sugar transporter subunit IIA n=1 Tax=Vagococcus allomyrinae TaxID=2794353 RepID=A0A940PD01_9ENTE|nr:PTS sugar transporter subunit IIA [Vagococcus allomyrinae]MBP1042302.1 PTS sugar transporter subunit IIA [Vagococcus allomyrinae]
MESLISKDYIFVKKTYENSDEVFEDLGKLLINQGYAKPTYIDALKTREEKFPTGLLTNGLGVAIPHTEASQVIKSRIVVAKLTKPVHFNEMGKVATPIDVDMIIMLALNDGKKHLEALQKIISIVGNHELLKALESADTCDAIYDVFDEVINS